MDRVLTYEVLPSIRKTGSYSVRDEQVVPHLTPEEGSQRITRERRLCLENGDLERQSILATRQALLDIGETIDDAQEWSIRDRLSNLLRGEAPSTEERSTHAGLFLVQDKGMSASLSRKVRSTFGRLAANALRHHRNNIATLPYSIKNVDGNPTRVALEQSRTFTYL